MGASGRLFIVGCSQGFPAHLDFKGVVEEPIAEGVGDGGFAHGGVPVFGGELTGDDGGGPAVAVLDDFKEVGALLIGEGGQEDVVDDQELGLGKLGEELKTGTVGAGLLELLEGPGGAEGDVYKRQGQ